MGWICQESKTGEDWLVMPYTLTKEEEKFWLSQPDEITILPIEEIEKKYAGLSNEELWQSIKDIIDNL